MTSYILYVIAFIINAAILAAISSISIETRFAINHTPDMKISSLGTFTTKILYYIRILPYKFADTFKLMDKSRNIPEWIKLLYTFFITFIIALIVYHLFLAVLGYKTVYKYFFGNLKANISK